MKKIVDFNNWKQLKKLSLNDFNRWVMYIYQSGYADGMQAQKYKIQMVEDNCSTFVNENLKKLLLTIPGIGEDRANQIMETIQCADDQYTTTFEELSEYKNNT